MADVTSTFADWSSTTASNNPSGSTNIGSGLDDNLREIQGAVVRGLSYKGSDLASATAPAIGGTEGLMHDITGTATITGFDTVRAGLLKILKFEGAATLTHNATSLILPGGANITTANGDVAGFISEGSGNWRCLWYSTASSGHLPFNDSDAVVRGSSDATKKVRFEVDGLTSATTRVITMPDADVTLGLGAATGVAQTFLTTSNVALNNTSNYFDVINTGSIGASGQKWLILAHAVVADGAGAAAFRVRIWDGTTVYTEEVVNTAGTSEEMPISLIALVTLSAATTFYLSAKDPTSTSGNVLYVGSAGTSDKTTSITAIRLV